ncbi:MAG: hypothetical protein JST93_05940 [Acidobacteria bacterium]|nr:hypothetical protein [Acidobacteriota bacterium]
MLVIRQPQLEAFREQPRILFEREMAGYLREYLPFEASHADVDGWVRNGLRQAGLYGFTSWRDSAQYLALMAMLGAGFLEDPAMPWARAIVSDGSKEPPERMGLLFDRAVEYLEATCGPRGVWFDRALARLLRLDLNAVEDAHQRAVAGRIGEELTRLYPQKATAIGGRALRDLVRMSGEMAASRREWLFRAACMLLLGAGFARDSCFPWAASGVGFDQMYQGFARWGEAYGR